VALSTHEFPSRSGVLSGLVAEVRPQPAGKLFQPRFGAIEEQFPMKTTRSAETEEAAAE